jgi:hypothetical protein
MALADLCSEVLRASVRVYVCIIVIVVIRITLGMSTNVSISTRRNDPARAPELQKPVIVLSFISKKSRRSESTHRAL